MDRQNLTQEEDDFVAAKRAEHHAAAEAGEDDQMDPKDRRNREHVLGPLARVQRDDDVLHNGQPLRVIGPGPGEGWFYALSYAPFGMIAAPFDGQYISDRAPADANEEALPIFIEPPAEEPDPPIEPEEP